MLVAVPNEVRQASEFCPRSFGAGGGGEGRDEDRLGEDQLVLAFGEANRQAVEIDIARDDQRTDGLCAGILHGDRVHHAPVAVEDRLAQRRVARVGVAESPGLQTIRSLRVEDDVLAPVGGDVAGHHRAGVESKPSRKSAAVGEEAGVVDDRIERLVVLAEAPLVLRERSRVHEVFEDVLVGLDLRERVSIEIDRVDVHEAQLARRASRAAAVDRGDQVQATEGHVAALDVVERDEQVPISAGSGRVEALEAREDDFIDVVSIDVARGYVGDDSSPVDLGEGGADQRILDVGVAGLAIIDDEIAGRARVRPVGAGELVDHDHELIPRVVVQIARGHRKRDRAVGRGLRQSLARRAERQAFRRCSRRREHGPTRRGPGLLRNRRSHHR